MRLLEFLAGKKSSNSLLSPQRNWHSPSIREGSSA
jgi:hypothetical protein